MTLYLLRRGTVAPPGPQWSEIEALYERVEHVLDRLQALCRPGTLVLVRLPFHYLIDERCPYWAEWLGQRGPLRVLPPEPEIDVSYDPTRLAAALDDFVSWRAEVAAPGTAFEVGWDRAGYDFRFSWTETTALAASCATHALAPEKDLSGLVAFALPHLARVASLHNGSLEIGRGPGFSLTMRWPLHVGASTPNPFAARDSS